MADRYQDRPFPADDGYDRGGDQHSSGRGESDPLAELARLIGQTDPFGAMGRANQRANPQAPPRANPREQYQPTPSPSPPEPLLEDDGLPSGPPPWLQRATKQEDPPEDYPSAVHPLQRHATPRAEPDYVEPNYAAPNYAESNYDDEPAYEDADQAHDPSRYDDALYGRLDTGAQDQGDPAYADDYAYQDGYGDEEPLPKRRSGMATIVVLLALAVAGTGAAFAYRSYIGSSRSGEPPIIRADAGPTKIVPAPSDGSAKLPDRMVTGDGAEKIVPREEAPVDVNARSGPRVVFPPLNQNGNPPPASVSPAGLAPSSASNGTLSNPEPRKIKIVSVRGDQADAGTTPVGSAPAPLTRSAAASKTAAPPPAPVTRSQPSSANASANAPISLIPGSQPAPAPAAPEPRTRVAATNPLLTAPSASAGGGNYMVQISAQPSEADAQASYRAMQGKYPAVLGSHSPLIKRVDLGEKGIKYRAMVGPFATNDEAVQFCSGLKTAGGQCFVQRN